MEDLGPLLVYDTKQRNVNFLTEEQARKAVAKLLALLRSNSLPELEAVLLRWFSIPRNVTYYLPKFHIENFGSLHLIGTGGFGTVFRARHQIDDKEYAIKVIRGTRSSSSLNLARSEVCMMARLSHENIIQYVTSWIEYDIPMTSPKDKYSGSKVQVEETPSENPTSLEHETDSSPESHRPSIQSSSSSDIVFDYSLNKKQLALPDLYANARPPQRKPKIHMIKPPVPRPILFIQMQMCRSNLAKWLEYRNGQLATSPTTPKFGECSTASRILGSLVPRGPARWMTDQIARGVAYLHSEQLMHRDLKPENVLICGPPFEQISTKPCACRPARLLPQRFDWDGSSVGNIDQSACYHHLLLKICDFGLARFWKQPDTASTRRRFRTNEPLEKSAHQTCCNHLPTDRNRHRSEQNRTSSSSTDRIRHSPSKSKPVHGYTRNGSTKVVTNSSDASSNGNWSLVPAVRGMSYDMLTANLGSVIYAAPETKEESLCGYTSYDYKADVFSMGVIFLQIFHPFHTLHELIDTLHAVSTENMVNLNKPNSPLPTHPLPPSFSLAWPVESRLVHRMLSKLSKSRPSVLEVLQILAPSSEFPDLLNHPSSVDIEDDNSTEKLDVAESPISILDEQADCSLLGHSTRRSHQVFDLLLHRNQELERKIVELTQRLSRYEQI